MATTGLAVSAASKFDATTPPLSSSLSPGLAQQLLVNLDHDIQSLKAPGALDLEGLTHFHRAANYL